MDKLNYHKIRTYSLHGIVSKEERQKAMEDFRRGKIKILVSSDLAARGLDIPNITHIINMDFSCRTQRIHSPGWTHRPRQPQRASATALSTRKSWQHCASINGICYSSGPCASGKRKNTLGATKEYYKDPERKKKHAAKSNDTHSSGKKHDKQEKSSVKPHKAGSQSW